MDLVSRFDWTFIHSTRVVLTLSCGLRKNSIEPKEVPISDQQDPRALGPLVIHFASWNLSFSIIKMGAVKPAWSS